MIHHTTTHTWLPQVHWLSRSGILGWLLNIVLMIRLIPTKWFTINHYWRFDHMPWPSSEYIKQTETREQWEACTLSTEQLTLHWLAKRESNDVTNYSKQMTTTPSCWSRKPCTHLPPEPKGAVEEGPRPYHAAGRAWMSKAEDRPARLQWNRDKDQMPRWSHLFTISSDVIWLPFTANQCRVNCYLMCRLLIVP